MGEQEKDRLEFQKMLIDDLSQHRSYIQQLYRNAAIIVGVGLGVVGTAAVFVLGDTLEKAVAAFGIDGAIDTALEKKFDVATTNLTNRATEQASAILVDIEEQAVEAAASAMRDFVAREFDTQAKEAINRQAVLIGSETIDQTVARLAIPSSAILSFALSDKCPDGWKEYEPAYGRFIRGIDLGTENTDPEGKRSAGSIQGDSIIAHAHSFSYRAFGHDLNDGGLPNKSEDNDGRPISSTTSDFGAAETRPKNVALLFCQQAG